MGRRNETIDFLIVCMENSLAELMNRKPFSKITVDEITAKAGVGRATYFRHFQSKEEVIERYLEQKWYEWCTLHHLEPVHDFDKDHALLFFAFNDSLKDFLFILYHNHLSSCLLNAFHRVFHVSNAHPIDYPKAFYTYGLYGIIDAWIKNGCKESPQEMKELGLKLIEGLS